MFTSFVRASGARVWLRYLFAPTATVDHRPAEKKRRSGLEARS
jgi:hypothetical protein